MIKKISIFLSLLLLLTCAKEEDIIPSVILKLYKFYKLQKFFTCFSFLISILSISTLIVTLVITLIFN